jgi:hypothetical protein
MIPVTPSGFTVHHGIITANVNVILLNSHYYWIEIFIIVIYIEEPNGGIAKKCLSITARNILVILQVQAILNLVTVEIYIKPG